MNTTTRGLAPLLLLTAWAAPLSATSGSETAPDATKETASSAESASLATGLVQDGDEDVDAKLEKMQSEIDELKASVETKGVTGDSETSLKIFGRIHLDAWGFPSTDSEINLIENGDPSEDPRNGLEFRRARIGVSGDIEDTMNYKIELEFGKPSEFAFKDVFFGFKDVPGNQEVLIGNQKRPYGLDHLNSSRYNVFLERPFVVESLNQDARRFGIAAYGVSEDQTLNWRYGVYEMTDWSKSGSIRSEKFQPEITGRLASTFWHEDQGRKYGHAALSGSYGWPDGSPGANDNPNQARFRTRPEARSESRWLDTGRISNADNLGIVGLEGAGNFGRTQVVGEVMNTWVQRGSGDADVSFWGGYAYVAFFLTDDYMPWSRKSGTLSRIEPSSPFRKGGLGAWQVAARYSYADFSDEDVLGGVGQSVTLGLNWWWNSHARLQFNYIKGRIEDREVTGPVVVEGDYDILGIRLMVDF